MPRFRAGQRLTAASLNAVLPRTAYKLNTTGRASTTTLTPDPDLFIDIPADALGTYAIEVFLCVTGPVLGSTAGIALGMSYSGTQVANTGTWMAQGNAVGSTTTVNFAGRSITGAGFSFGTNGNNFSVVLMNGLISAATAGTLAVVWAQNASGTTPVNVRSASWLKLTPLDT